MEATDTRLRQAKSSVWCRGDVSAGLCAETPSEVASLVQKAKETDQAFVQLTLANPSTWNGKPLFLAPHIIEQISPPMEPDGGD